MTYLNDIGQYPVTASLDAQNALLSNISDQIVIDHCDVSIEVHVKVYAWTMT